MLNIPWTVQLAKDKTNLVFFNFDAGETRRMEYTNH